MTSRDGRSVSECSDSSTGSDSSTHILYRNRAEWADVTPEPVDKEDGDILRISYSEKFQDCFGYLRAVINSGELSERVFELTTTCAGENPACYTVWVLRRTLLQHLNKDYRDEMRFMSRMILDNQKNYQVWYHRQRLVKWLDDATGELAFLDEILKQDSKNYHAWQYRQWLLTTFNLWDDELDFTTALLIDDLRNNSAWNQRYFVISKTTGFTRDVVEREIRFTQEKILQASVNESAWNYLEGLLEHCDAAQRADVLNWCEQLRDDGAASVFLFSTLLQMYEKEGQLDKATEVVGVLRREDGLRTQYWAFRENLLELSRGDQ